MLAFLARIAGKTAIEQEGCLQVHLEHARHFSHRLLTQMPLAGIPAGIVHQDIDAAPSLIDGLIGFCDLVRVGGIGGTTIAAFPIADAEGIEAIDLLDLILEVRKLSYECAADFANREI